MCLSSKQIWFVVGLTVMSILLCPLTLSAQEVVSVETTDSTMSMLYSNPPQFSTWQVLKAYKNIKKEKKKSEKQKITINNLQIADLKVSRPKKLITNLNAYVGWSAGEKCDYWQLASAAPNLYSSSLTAGLEVEMHTTGSTFLSYGVNLGYEYKRIGTNINLFSLYGIDTHWLKPEVFVEFAVMRFGVATDILLATAVRDTPKFTYNGIYNDCFNPVLPSVFIGFVMPLPFVRIEGRANACFINLINAEKVAMHTYQTVSMGAFSVFSFSLRLSVPLLTQENKIISLFPASMR